MKKYYLYVIAVSSAMGFTVSARGQTPDTISKVKASGEISMGVRDSSGALSYTLGDGKYVGYHVEICQRIIAEVGKQRVVDNDGRRGR
jgi:glutamate/aspartate transport system substrate-binding protein